MSLPENKLPDVVQYPIQEPWHIITLGEGVNGKLIYINLKITPHILLAGSKDNSASLSGLLHYGGSVVNSILAHAMKSSLTWKIYGLDMNKRLSSNQWETLNIVERMDIDSESCVQTAEELLAEIQSRYHRMGNSSSKLYDLPNFSPILIMVDDLELLEWPLAQNHKAALTEETHRRKLMMMLGEISRIGGQVGVHMLAGLQFPKEKDLAHLVRNFSCRVVTAPLNTAAKNFILNELKGDNEVSVNFPNQLPGRAYIQANEEIIAFQLFNTSFSVLKQLEN